MSSKYFKSDDENFTIILCLPLLFCYGCLYLSGICFLQTAPKTLPLKAQHLCHFLRKIPIILSSLQAIVKTYVHICYYIFMCSLFLSLQLSSFVFSIFGKKMLPLTTETPFHPSFVSFAFSVVTGIKFNYCVCVSE